MKAQNWILYVAEMPRYENTFIEREKRKLHIALM